MDIMKIMKQAHKLKKVQKEIAKMVITDGADGATLTITGDGDVKSLKISEELYASGRENVEKTVSKALALCLKKQQELQKEKAKEAMGGMGLPDMLG